MANSRLACDLRSGLATRKVSQVVQGPNVGEAVRCDLYWGWLTSRSTGPLARIRSPRPVNVGVRRPTRNEP